MKTSAEYREMMLGTIEESIVQGKITREEGCALYGMVTAFFLLHLITGDDMMIVIRRLEKVYGLSNDDWDKLLV